MRNFDDLIKVCLIKSYKKDGQIVTVAQDERVNWATMRKFITDSINIAAGASEFSKYEQVAKNFNNALLTRGEEAERAIESTNAILQLIGDPTNVEIQDQLLDATEEEYYRLTAMLHDGVFGEYSDVLEGILS